MGKHYLFLLILIVFAGCSSAPVDDQIHVGGIFALTSYGSITGIEEQRAVQLAFEQQNAKGGIDGRELVLITEDSATDSSQAVSAFTKLTQVQGVKYVLGPTWEASTASVVPLAEQQDLVLVATSSYDTVKRSEADNIFALYPPYEYEIQGLMPYFEKQGYTRYGIIHKEEFYGEIMQGLFTKEVERKGWEIVDVLSIPETDNDFRSHLLKLKEQDVDVIYAPFEYPSLHLFAKQAKELGVQATIVALYNAENSRIVAETAQDVEGIVYARPVESEQYAAFAQAYEQRYGEAPADPAAATGYDAANLLIDALESGADTPEEVADYLDEVQGYPGASNTITFTDDRVVEDRKYVAKMIVDGEFVALS